jgi:uncharacterized protein (TIGR00106 family)
MEFSMTPLGEGVSVSKYVARVLEVVEASGLDYRLHSMGTIVEGELPQVLDLLAKCFAALEPDCERVSCAAKFDYRPGHSGRLEAKVKSVEDQLGRQLRT